jgi:hypothetical protein
LSKQQDEGHMNFGESCLLVECYVI